MFEGEAQHRMADTRPTSMMKELATLHGTTLGRVYADGLMNYPDTAAADGVNRGFFFR